MANKTTTKKSTAKKAAAKKYSAKSVVEKSESRLDNAVTLDELMGLSSPNMFGAKTEQEFEKNLNDMTLLDMHKLATKAGLLPVHDRTLMKKRLNAAFAQYVKSLRPFKMRNQKHYAEGSMTKSDESKVRKILAGGR